MWLLCVTIVCIYVSSSSFRKRPWAWNGYRWRYMSYSFQLSWRLDSRRSIPWVPDLKSTAESYINIWLGVRIVAFTHLPLVLHICVSESGHHWFRQWLAAFSTPSHYINQRCVIVNCTLRNELQWNFNQNIKTVSSTKMHLNISSAKWRPFCPGGDEWAKAVGQSFNLFLGTNKR